MFLAQTSLTLGETFSFIAKCAEIVVLPFLAYMNARFKRLDKNIVDLEKSVGYLSEKLAIVNTTLVGQTGNNGLASRMNRIEEWRDDISSGARKLQ